MSLSEMLQRREIQKVEPDGKTAGKLLKVSQDALVAAEDNLKMMHNDVALSLAYNAMLNAGRALMAAKGYRVHSETHHKAVVGFCSAALPSESSKLVALFNRYRIRRHDIVYGEIEGGSVGESEARGAIEKANEFLRLIKTKLS
ncbi:MAG: HEPN domain-containing protein [Candidatus Micrarchaeota archaeon]|nr:HEPN domain-containing protein [Candidatus Micrarchaeota archaeon]